MIAIRPARPDDVDAIAEIAEAAYAPFVAEIGRRPAPMDAPFAERVAAGRVDVATLEAGSLPRAYVIAFAEDAATWHVENLAVHPEAQGRGLGASLLAEAETRARAAGRHRVALYTNVAMRGAQALYLSRGYRETSRGAEAGFHRIHYVKDLAEQDPDRRTPPA